jgi:excinuclease ABC subunit C
VLELIPNLGEKRRRELLAHFAGMQGLLSASETEIGKSKGLVSVLARQIYKILHE